jgi:hypothetical protein
LPGAPLDVPQRVQPPHWVLKHQLPHADDDKNNNNDGNNDSGAGMILATGAGPGTTMATTKI